MKRLVWLAMACLFVGCGGVEDPGDSNNNGNNGNQNNNTCSTNTDCGATNVCVSSQCTLAAGRQYRLTIVDAQTSTTDPADQSAWDALGGAPDPFVTLTIDGQLIGHTSTQQDTFTPAWNEYFDVVINETSVIVFDVVDEDATTNDPMGKLGVPDPISFVHNGGGSGMTDSGALTSFRVTVTPR